MSLSVQDCFNRAVNRSSLNSAGLFGVNNALSHMSIFEQRAFIMAANVNPDFDSRDGLTVVRTAFTDSWNLNAAPGGIGLINRVEVATIAGTVTDVAVKDEIFIVDKGLSDLALPPRAFIQAKVLKDINTELGAADANMVTQLRIFYSFIPVAFSTSTDVLSLADEWSHLVATPMAAIMAMADQRMEEYDRLTAEYQRDLQLYLQHVGGYRHSFMQPLGQAPASSPNVPQFGGN